jgi:hypothetical protein
VGTAILKRNNMLCFKLYFQFETRIDQDSSGTVQSSSWAI